MEEKTEAQKKKDYDRHKWTRDNTKAIAVHLQKETAEQFKEAALRNGTTTAELLKKWIAEYIEQNS